MVGGAEGTDMRRREALTSGLSLAGLGLLGPLVQSLEAEAQGVNSARKRFVLYNIANSIQLVQIRRTQVRSETDFTLQGALTPFEPFKSDLLVADSFIVQQKPMMAAIASCMAAWKEL
jgi:hypothetical protein